MAITNTAANNVAETNIVSGTNKTLNHNAWNIGATYVLTGEDNSFKGIKPKNNFDLDKGTWGAWEAGLRYSALNLDDDTFKAPDGSGYQGEGATAAKAYSDRSISAKSAKTWTAGINWYLDQNTKFALNYLDTSFDGGAGSLSSLKDRKDERAIFGRLQISY